MSDRPLAITTVSTSSHLSRVRVLAQSLLRHHPELSLSVLLVDEPAGRFDPADQPFDVIRLEDVEHRDLLAQVGAHRAAGDCANSMKAALLEHVLAGGCWAAIHLDTDMLVTGRLDPLIAALDGGSVVLTPHLLTSPRGLAARSVLQAVQVAGVMNGGVVGVRGDARGRAFLGWWGDRLAVCCTADPARGVFHDQRWLDLAPGLLEGVAILDDPGTNVAFWNLTERPLTRHDGELRAGGVPCRLLHLSGYDPGRPHLVSVHMPDLTTDVAGLLGEITAQYREALVDAGWEESSTWPWVYATP
ncbi:unannotated protein [freshwater metagenome]|uniref:Unannotated protein n=1 Tax=freshwater metagenome TaxID=449393 RepID=A0A6J7HX50_9ZZZZ|nr:hypothetical protein [Actinomycetota bacterium]